MNIFKVLANGDGTLNEPNISAFLGYLLNPNADHGLGFEFLKRFLEISFQYAQDFDPTKYEFKIYFEQAFKKDNSKKIVDIVIVCYSFNIKNTKESLVHQFVKNNRTLEKIFLVENKINVESRKEEQLENQFEATFEELKIIDVDKNLLNNEIYTIYLTPEEKIYEDLFREAGLIKSSHIIWKSKIGSLCIKDILKEIVFLNSIGEIEPINEQVIFTIKAFIQFIDSNFKSELQEEKVRKEKGEVALKNEEFGVPDLLQYIKDTLLKKVQVEEDKLIVDMSDAHHPSLFIVLNKCKIQLLLRDYGRNGKVFFYIYPNDYNRDLFLDLAKSLNEALINNDKYFRIKKLPLNWKFNDNNGLIQTVNEYINICSIKY